MQCQTDFISGLYIRDVQDRPFFVGDVAEAVDELGGGGESVHFRHRHPETMDASFQETVYSIREPLVQQLQVTASLLQQLYRMMLLQCLPRFRNQSVTAVD